MTEFMNKTLDRPIIASSCIATENVWNIRRLLMNGVQGIILKSCADYERSETSDTRQFAVDKSGFVYASSPFEKEILTLEECLVLLSKLRKKTDALLIPSFTAASLEPSEWLGPCQRLAESGADGIQLDFFYMGSLIGTDNFRQRMTALLRELVNGLDVPIMPKLNVDLPKDFIMPILAEAGVEYVSLLDSVTGRKILRMRPSRPAYDLLLRTLAAASDTGIYIHGITAWLEGLRRRRRHKCRRRKKAAGGRRSHSAVGHVPDKISRKGGRAVAGL